jgi:hypothetical protein
MALSGLSQVNINAGLSVGVVLLSGVATLFLTYIENPDQKYQSKAAEIEKNRRDQLSGTLGEIIADAHQYVEEVSDRQATDVFTEAEQATMILQDAWEHTESEQGGTNNGLSEGHISTLDNDINHMAEPRNTYDFCSAAHRNSFYFFASSLIIGLMLVPLLFDLSVGGPASEFVARTEITGFYNTLVTALLFLSIVCLGAGVIESLRWDKR